MAGSARRAPASAPSGFWARLETWVLALQQDRARLARYLRVAYWISTGFVVVGFLVMILVAMGRWPPW